MPKNNTQIEEHMDMAEEQMDDAVIENDDEAEASDETSNDEEHVIDVAQQEEQLRTRSCWFD